MLSKMNSRERVIAALKRQDVDYVPCSPFFNPLTEVQRKGYKYQFPFRHNNRKEMYEYCVNELGIDITVTVGFSSFNPAPDVSSKVSKEGNIIRKVWNTPAGELHSAVKYDEKWPFGDDIPLYSDFIGHFVEPWIKSDNDLKCLGYLLRPVKESAALDKLHLEYQESKKIADRFNLATVAHIGSGLTGAQQLFGAEQLCMMTIDNPGLVDGYLELEHQVNLNNIKIACDFGADIIRRNGFYETCDFYSPEMLKKFLGKRLREEINTVHQSGKVIGYTVHTGIAPMLDYLRKLAFDCLMHIDIVFKDLDIRKVKDSQEGTKSFWLGPSNTYHMWSKDPEIVREAVRKVFQVFGKKGLLITACPSSHSIMPWENTLAMIDEWKKLRNNC